MKDLIYSQYVGELSYSVIYSDNPNEKLKKMDSHKRDLFYIVKFVTIIWNGGIDAYLLGYCGDDLLNTYRASLNLNIQSLEKQIDSLLKCVPELRQVKDDHVATYQRILRDRKIDEFSDLYEFDIKDDINKELEIGLRSLLSTSIDGETEMVDWLDDIDEISD